MFHLLNVPDIVIHNLFPRLTDKERIRLISITVRVRTRFLTEIWFDNIHDIYTRDTVNKWYYQQLRYVRIHHPNIILPYKLDKLVLSDTMIEFKRSIPSTVTHLTFGAMFNSSVIGMIPSGVTHLIFGEDFDQDVRGAIPNGVIEVTFGNQHSHDLDGAFPEGMTHLSLGTKIHHYAKWIPNSVTHLSLKTNYGWFYPANIFSPYDIPLLRIDYLRRIRPFLPTSLIELKIDEQLFDLDNFPKN